MSVADSIAKYDSSNYVVRFFISSLQCTLVSALSKCEAESLLDIGCGTGEAIALAKAAGISRYVGLDTDPDSLAFCHKYYSACELLRASAYALPFRDASFSVGLCCEVLEHLDDPKSAIEQMRRVISQQVIISVPHEPFFQLGSLLRGKYIRKLGNHPEHVQHWNPNSFRQMLSPYFKEVRISTSFPWIVALCIC